MAELQPVLWLIPVSILAQSLIKAANFWNTRKSAFSTVAVGKIAQAAVTTCLALALGIAGYGTASSMVGSSVAGFACAALMLVIVSLAGASHQEGKDAMVNVSSFSLLRRYRKFATHSTGPAVLNAMSWQLPALLMGAFFSAGTVGLYALTMKVIQNPVGLIHQAVSHVFYREVAKARADGALDKLVSGLFASLSKAALLPCLLLLITGRDLFAFIFGPAWDQAGLFAQILAPWVFVWFITSPLSVIYLALERQEEEIKVQSTIFTARCLSLLAGGYIGDPVVAVALFALSGVLAYTYLFFVICRCAGASSLNIARSFSSELFTALLCCCPAALAVSLGWPSVVAVATVCLTVAAHAIRVMRHVNTRGHARTADLALQPSIK